MRDKGSDGDYRGQFKLKATKEFTYIFLMLDWRSPFRNYSEEHMHAESLRSSELTQKDVEDPTFKTAYDKYQELLYGASRSLKTLDKMKTSLDKLDQYFEDVDFAEEDKQGKVKYTVEAYLNNIQKAEKAYESIERFERKVITDLENAGSIQGNRKLGVRERQFAFENKQRKWQEAGPTEQEPEEQEEEQTEDDTFNLGE